ncbi:putative inner membrane protein [Chlamydia psittaci WC]|uniref:IncV family inclusion membrane protein n=1 Tax=Chlamydia psittaci TaxID=83554 RepID=UPI00027E1449|nr:IncV family inclusion membrane protein [Chlamydia psittaci]AFS26109.1 putative inner membrane protein [Chlamydia psittaci WC]
MGNPLDPLGQSHQPIPRNPVPAPHTGLGKRIGATSVGFFGRLLSLPDRNPKMRYVFDIGIIAIAVISIIGILVASQGQGLLLFGLIPGFIFGALGLTMLVSDIADTPKSQKIADTITAVLLPFILLGIASALIASAYFTAGGSTLILANPQFLMGFMTIGLALVSLSKVTFQHFKTQALIKAQQKVIDISEQSIAPNAPYERDARRVSHERRRDFAAEARREHADQENRMHTRHRHISQTSQGVLYHSPRNHLEVSESDSDSISLENGENSTFLQRDFSFLHDAYNPFSYNYQAPSLPLEGLSSAAQNVPLGQAMTGEPVLPGPLTSTPRRVSRVESVSSTRSRNRDEEQHSRDSSHNDDESSDAEGSELENKQTRKKRKKKN